jgi:hypothetical protein
MIHLIYISSATRVMSEEDLLELLVQSRACNKTKNVTGMLLYRNDAFLQVLEGEAKHVDEIYRSILSDERNTGHYLIEREEISERQFPDWSMGFEDLSNYRAEELDSFSDIFLKKKMPDDIANYKDMVVALLLKF